MRFGVTISVLLACLACGGVWAQAKANAWADFSVELASMPEGEERDRVQHLIEEGYLHAMDGSIGILDEVAFERPFEAALEDEVLTEEEVTELERIVGEWMSEPTPPDPVRSERLTEMRRLAAKKTVEKKERIQVAFETWEMPEDLEARMTGIGVAVSGCDSDLYEGLRTTDCEGLRADDWVHVRVEQYRSRDDAREDEYDSATYKSRRGKTVMWVDVISRSSSKAFSDALVESGPLTSIDSRVMKRMGAGLGYAKRDAACDTDAEEGWRDVDCSWDARGVTAEARIYYRTSGTLTGPIEQDDDFDEDGWEVRQGDVELAATVRKRSEAKALYSTLMK